ncbi:MAG: Uma2 family endonuclease [Acidobacteriota bacterium]|nr:Uma2 family endonuclease [Acidobacteriota bacterium]
MATVATPYISPEEYLERERHAETRSEYLRGEVFAMAGGSLRHARIITSLVRRLAEKVGNYCDVYSTDVRLAIPMAQLYTYPDVMVVCGQLLPSEDTVSDPILIVEVLSDSTKSYDRGDKFHYYRSLPSLMEYMTVAQDKIHVEHWVRQPSAQWLFTELTDAAAALQLPSLSLELRIADIYEKVDFEERTG